MAKKKKKGISCLGVLLIFCMLLIAASTLTVNLLFRNNNAPEILGKRYCYYTENDMGDRIPAGELVIAEQPDNVKTQDIVLYRTPDQGYRIAVASLIVETSSTVPDASGTTFYLTTVTNTTAISVSDSDIVGICTRRSPELGVLVGFLTGTAGIIAGLILPCVILILYMIAVIIGNREANRELPEDEDTDLAFVKSIQRKQQEIAERDAERLAKEQQEHQSTIFAPEKPEQPKRSPRLSDEEIERMEEEEAARRAERIAAVRSHMEQRRQTETPDGVPLYTTEIITKTHTLSIPKVGDKPLTTTQNTAPAVPASTGSVPRLTATGHLQIPTPEQLAQEEREAEALRMKRAQEIAKAAQDDVFAAPVKADKEPVQSETVKNDTPVQEPVSVPEKVQEIAEDVKQTVQDTVDAAADQAEQIQETVSEVKADTSAAAPKPADDASAAPAPAPAPAKPVKKQKIASSSFNDLMSFLNNEQKKLK